MIEDIRRRQSIGPSKVINSKDRLNTGSSKEVDTDMEYLLELGVECKLRSLGQSERADTVDMESHLVHLILWLLQIVSLSILPTSHLKSNSSSYEIISYCLSCTCLLRP